VFKNLLEKDLKESLGVVNECLDKPAALRDWVADLGGIYRIRCFGVDEYTDSGTGETKSKEPRCVAYSSAGVPTMKEEVCVEMLEAGFLPKTNRFLRDKLKFVLMKACEKISEKMHISITKSTSMICIADDLGVLEENEVSIRFGKPFRDKETGRNRYYIEGDVLVARVKF
jgi:RNA dependent RNA polymerase